MLRIKPKDRTFETKAEIERFIRKQLLKADSFTGIQCSGNSYDYEACDYLA